MQGQFDPYLLNILEVRIEKKERKLSRYTIQILIVTENDLVAQITQYCALPNTLQHAFSIEFGWEAEQHNRRDQIIEFKHTPYDLRYLENQWIAFRVRNNIT